MEERKGKISEDWKKYVATINWTIDLVMAISKHYWFDSPGSEYRKTASVEKYSDRMTQAYCKQIFQISRVKFTQEEMRKGHYTFQTGQQNKHMAVDCMSMGFVLENMVISI